MVVSPSPPKKAWHGDALLLSDPNLEPAFHLLRLLSPSLINGVAGTVEIYSHGPGGWKSKIKVLARVIPSEDMEGLFVPGLFPGFRWVD